MIDKTRRAVLGAIGALAVGTATVSATDDEVTYDDDVNRCRDDEGKFTECGEEPEPADEPEKCGECGRPKRSEPAREELGTIYIENKTNCTRKVEVQVSGEIMSDPGVESDDTFRSIHVAANDYVEYYFTGSIRRLDVEHGKVDIEIGQRSAHDANSDACHD